MEDIGSHQFRYFAGKRSIREWASIVRKSTRDRQLRGWLASVIWWSHPQMRSGDALDRLAEGYNPFSGRSWQDLRALMLKVGLPWELQTQHEERDRMKPRHREVPDAFRQHPRASAGALKLQEAI